MRSQITLDAYFAGIARRMSRQAQIDQQPLGIEFGIWLSLGGIEFRITLPIRMKKNAADSVAAILGRQQIDEIEFDALNTRKPVAAPGKMHNIGDIEVNSIQNLPGKVPYGCRYLCEPQFSSRHQKFRLI